jgi:hypothetical protein
MLTERGAALRVGMAMEFAFNRNGSGERAVAENSYLKGSPLGRVAPMNTQPRQEDTSPGGAFSLLVAAVSARLSGVER